MCIRDRVDGARCFINKPLVDTITLSHIGTAKKINWSIQPPPNASTHSFSFEILGGSLKKKEIVTIKITLVVNTTCELQQIISLDVEGLGRHFLIVKLASEKSVFGVNPEELDLINDNNHEVPSVLVTMKNYLLDNNGLHKEGIFRLSGDEKEIMSVKEKLSKSQFHGCDDINCIASLIKLWFRELPSSILGDISPATFSSLALYGPEDALEIVEKLTAPKKSLLMWLVDILADTAQLVDENRMNPRNLAIVVAPNLFVIDQCDPLESLMTSQKIVNFLMLLIEWRQGAKYTK
eukprot:TRINITY_DN1373_c0_g1_i3.p1 TRINITY_DN1373_c0_g1~~TRINITY_DN1373_c0_g1_i3.p1  ORF type:complete len:293 (-),score=44.49 TRINITY_DN1373_c0_g1_i3:54-932(-)